MTQEALKLALEALEDRVSLMKWQKARDAVKEALAQPEQEPIPFGIRGSIAHDLGIKNNFSNQRSSQAAHGIKE
jgi:hypothetical protein